MAAGSRVKSRASQAELILFSKTILPATTTTISKQKQTNNLDLAICRFDFYDFYLIDRGL
jgi:hypothetical protein